jgi:peptide/nickel transport system substrate-binding protein
MKNIYRILAVCLVLAMVLSAGLLVVAQEESGPGEGGIVIRGNTRGSANLGPLLPLRCSGVDCADLNALMWPGLLALDPATQNYNPDLLGQGQLTNGWTVSEDGLTYTFTLREDAFWNDGEQITADDVYFSWLAARQGEAIGLSSSYAPISQDVVAGEIIDDFTIAFTVSEVSCTALDWLRIPAMPAHAFGFEVASQDTYDWTQFIDHPYDDEPVVTSGPFNFFRTEPGTAVYLQSNLDYWDPNGEFISPQGFVYLDTPDETVLVERFLTFQEGEPNFVFEPTANFATLRESDAQFYESPGRVWHYVGLNLADPTNPQNGLADPLSDWDPETNPHIDQGIHPIFGDVLVRQALQHAVNIEEVINGALNGDASPMVGSTIPTAFTIHPELERRAFDLDAARALLDQAGWTSTGDPVVAGGDGLRTCTACTTAEAGTPLAFTIVNPGGPRNDVSVILQASFAQIGVQVEVQPLDFNTLYDDNMGAQTYDAAVAGWRGGLPFDPDQRDFFGVQNDIYGEGYGFNFPSYFNEEFETLGGMVNTVEGCDPQGRMEIAWRMQEILYEEQPYLWLYALNSVYAAAPQVSGFAPFPNFGQWNIDSWVVSYE